MMNKEEKLPHRQDSKGLYIPRRLTCTSQLSSSGMMRIRDVPVHQAPNNGTRELAVLFRRQAHRMAMLVPAYTSGSDVTLGTAASKLSATTLFETVTVHVLRSLRLPVERPVINQCCRQYRGVAQARRITRDLRVHLAPENRSPQPRAIPLSSSERFLPALETQFEHSARSCRLPKLFLDPSHTGACLCSVNSIRVPATWVCKGAVPRRWMVLGPLVLLQHPQPRNAALRLPNCPRTVGDESASFGLERYIDNRS